MVTDWSNRATIYTNPDTPEEAAAKGRTAQWRLQYQDPRFVAALVRKLERQADAKYGPARSSSGRMTATKDPMPGLPGWKQIQPPADSPETVHRDWSAAVGGGTDVKGGVGAANTYPAKYSFDINATPSCDNDFIVFGTGAAGANSVNNTDELWNGSFSATATAGTITIGGTAPRQVVISFGTANSGTTFTGGGSATNSATNLRAAINRWTRQTGFKAGGTGTNVTISSDDTEGNHTDTLISNGLTSFALAANTQGAGTAGQATIVAFRKLYTGATNCTTPRVEPNSPDVYWAYNTGTGASVTTSPVLSFYGNANQVAFVQSVGGTASLVLLKWKSGEGTPGVPATPTNVYTSLQGAAYRSCVVANTQSCMITFSLGAGDSFSSPYVIYGADVAYIGDNAGVLHKFTGLFRSGTPTEVTTSPWPKTVSSGNALSSPTYDFTNGQVFVGSARGAGSGGQLHRINATSGAAVDSGVLVSTTAANPGVRTAPQVDSSNGDTYVYVANDGVNACNNGAATSCRAIYRFTNLFAANAVPSGAANKVTLGVGNTTTRNQYAGTADDAYFNSNDGTGSFYVCGNGTGSAALATTTTLYKIGLSAGDFGTVVSGPKVSIAGSTGDCSPVAELVNTSVEYLYFSVPDHADDGAATVCGGLATSACLYLVNLSNLNQVFETWDMPFTGKGNANETVTVNGVVTTVGTNWAGGNNASQSSANFANYVNANSGTIGMTAGTPVNTGGGNFKVTLTAVAAGDKLDGGFADTMANGGPWAVVQQGSNGSSTWGAGNVPFAGLSVSGGTTGLIMDNVSTSPGASQVYFMNLTQPANATQASQKGLQ